MTSGNPAHCPNIPGAVRAVLPDGRRQHFQHGPIDLVLEAWGSASGVARAYDQAWQRFQTILDELVGELPALRTPIAHAPQLQGDVARLMAAACAPYRDAFVTPMAAVAGAVADTVLAAMTDGTGLAKAYVNNGGDIALHLSAGEKFRTGMVALAETPAAAGIVTIGSDDGVGGLATSGWRGRSLSRGIADSVTVLAGCAAQADVAATLTANAVNTNSPQVQRVPARELDPDSDLGDLPVTTSVGALTDSEIADALDAGVSVAREIAATNRIKAASLTLCGAERIATSDSSPSSEGEVAERSEVDGGAVDQISRHPHPLRKCSGTSPSEEGEEKVHPTLKKQARAA